MERSNGRGRGAKRGGRCYSAARKPMASSGRREKSRVWAGARGADPADVGKATEGLEPRGSASRIGHFLVHNPIKPII
ncbi:hypothetical protein K0M31_011233 [Melipona bicolor]|uniref:Uncharacterized protein n=1 Tax=Melipona bicolor TaxID=60889 RepID=A0AA40GAD1_9HYME|nr:hypothetical protein K0M31_011233 [Melipona bicolor]